MSNPAFRRPEKPTQFQQDINELVEQLKLEINIIYERYKRSPRTGIWIYGSVDVEKGKLQPENQEMLLFHQYTDKLLEKYSHKLTETEPKSISEAYQYIREQGQFYNRKNKKIAVEIAIWIEDVKEVSKTEDLNNVLEEIETLKNRLSDFKHFEPLKTRFSLN